MPRSSSNPADRVVRARIREPIQFQHLSERMALKLSSVMDYTARSHFQPWHRILGTPDFVTLTGVFSPLVFVGVEVSDARVDGGAKVEVRGETYLARTLDAQGNLRHLIREGRHVLYGPDGTRLGNARLVNAFTRYDSDPVRRRVTELPPEWKMGTVPSRVVRDVPTVDTIVPRGRRPDFADTTPHVWHYGHTDANRHVNSMEYLRVAESFVADGLLARGLDVKRLFFARAGIVYRKPCFAGEGYRCEAWFQGEAPLVVAVAIHKADDAPGRPPAAAVELELRAAGA